MTFILLQKANGNRIFIEHIRKIIGAFAVCGIISKDIIVIPKRAEVIILEYECDSDINIKNGIVIVKPNSAIQNIPKDLPIIIPSFDKSALNSLLGRDNPIIACGMGNRDTVSISAICNGNASICLNRSIITASGELCEECEILLPKDDSDDYELMCAAAILLYCEKYGF